MKCSQIVFGRLETPRLILLSVTSRLNILERQLEQTAVNKAAISGNMGNESERIVSPRGRFSKILVIVNLAAVHAAVLVIVWQEGHV